MFPPGGTKYACESKVVTPSKVDPNCVPTSVVVEKPTGEFGVNLDGIGPESVGDPEFVLELSIVNLWCG